MNYNKCGLSLRFISKVILGDCETGLVFDVQKRQTPDFVGDKQEK